ncbi:hypothetical protein [Streptomyces sp. NRRL B-24572]|uniref:hypothetical protein n=1 Tax=Streptomyces sp. NRRL B-24572 TaxID=1962156 RepID=UPI000A3BF4C2|nr:hypothetical protein [Streptomyces sp. NRRL B-24572]
MLFLLGLLLLGATGAFIGLLISENTGGPDHAVMMFDNRIATMDGLSIFLAGMALAVIVGIACALMASGAARARRRRTLGRRAYGQAAPRSRERGGEAYEGRETAPRTEGDAAAVTGRRPRHRFRFGH